MTYLLKIQGVLNNTLADNSAISKDEMIKYLSNDIIWDLQKAILCGEHYSPDAKQVLTSIETTILNIEALVSFQPNELKSSDRQWKDIKEGDFPILFKSIAIFIKWHSSTFNLLIDSIEKGLTNFSEGRDGVIVDTSKFQGYNFFQDFSIVFGPDTVKNITNYNIFYTNISLAYLDEYLECKEEIILLLQNIRFFLNDVTTTENEENDIRKALLNKSAFLEYKINFRNSRPTKEYQAGANVEPQIERANVFFGFVTKIEKHYYSMFNPAELHNKIDGLTIESVRQGEIELEHFHHLNRHYCKGDPQEYLSNKKNIERLLAKLKSLDPAVSSLILYDQIAFRSVYKLLSNSTLKLQFDHEEKADYKNVTENIQSYLSDDRSEDLKYLEDTRLEMERMSALYSFPDYYCYILFIKHFNSFINYFVSNPQALITEKVLELEDAKIQKRITSLLEYIKKLYGKTLFDLRQNLWIMMTHKVKPVYLTMKECKVKCQWTENDKPEERSLFLDSSYILPLNFERVTQKVQTWESFLIPQLNILKDSIEIYLNQCSLKKSIANFTDKNVKDQASFKEHIKKNEEKFQKEVKQNEFKLVQIVAMFVTIAVFVLSSVSIFQDRNGLQSLAILLGLMACFIVFNGFFYAISIYQIPEEATIKRSKYVLIVIIVLTFALLITSYGILNKQELSIPPNIEEKIKMEAKKLDSLVNLRMSAMEDRGDSLQISLDTLHKRFNDHSGSIIKDLKKVSEKVKENTDSITALKRTL